MSRWRILSASFAGGSLILKSMKLYLFLLLSNKRLCSPISPWTQPIVLWMAYVSSHKALKPDVQSLTGDVTTQMVAAIQHHFLNDGL